jgi:flagellar biogenesis protein FliO
MSIPVSIAASIAASIAVSIVDGQSAAEVGQFEGRSSLLWMSLQTFLALGFVLMLAYIVLRIILPRILSSTRHPLTGATRAAESLIRVVETTALSEQCRLHVIEVTGRWFLLTSSGAEGRALVELDAAAAEEAMAKRRSAAFQRGLSKAGTLAAWFAKTVDNKRRSTIKDKSLQSSVFSPRFRVARQLSTTED